MPASGFDTKPGTIQRRWAYSVLRQGVDAEPAAPAPSGPPGAKPARARPAKEMELRYPGTCANCGMALAAGEVAFYNPDTRTVTCLRHSR